VGLASGRRRRAAGWPLARLCHTVGTVFLVRDLVSARAWLATIHHLAGLLIGIPVGWIIVTGFALGFGLVPLLLAGLLVLGVTMRLAGLLASWERARFALLLGVRIPPWPAGARAGYRWGIIPRWRMLWDRGTWGTIGYWLARPVVSFVAFTVVVTAWGCGLAMVTLPLYNRDLPAGGADIGGDVLHGWHAMLVPVTVGIVLVVAAPQLARGFAAMDVALSRRLLGPPSDLAARVSELEVSRDRVVDAAEAERRRIERDLHDGAQQRLVALAMELGRAKARFADDVDAARVLVDQAHAQAKEALTELRSLVRGVHPPVLTDRGLDAALSGLAALCPVPVIMRVDVPVRPRASVEAVAYFVVAEALTNVAKHSRASQAKVTVEGRGYPGTLTVMISDDGIGGADPDGAGLSGLADRVSGVDGRLSVESPSGGPTIIAAELPCG
jgi:signal transduction histidine kinase